MDGLLKTKEMKLADSTKHPTHWITESCALEAVKRMSLGKDNIAKKLAKSLSQYGQLVSRTSPATKDHTGGVPFVAKEE